MLRRDSNRGYGRDPGGLDLQRRRHASRQNVQHDSDALLMPGARSDRTDTQKGQRGNRSFGSGVVLGVVDSLGGSQAHHQLQHLRAVPACDQPRGPDRMLLLGSRHSSARPVDSRTLVEPGKGRAPRQSPGLCDWRSRGLCVPRQHDGSFAQPLLKHLTARLSERAQTQTHLANAWWVLWFIRLGRLGKNFVKQNFCL